MNKYAFWLIPEEEVFTEMQKVIIKYSQKYNTPVFIPHLTILSGVKSTDNRVVKDIHAISNQNKPFKLELGKVEFSTTYFQCVFVRIKTRAQLLNTHIGLREKFGYKEEHVYMPHASLVYGDFDMETREKICSEIVLKETEFVANSIVIVRADSGDPNEWDVVRKVTLSG